MGDGDGADSIGVVPEDVTEAGHRLQSTGDTLRSAWTDTAAAIVGFEGGIGHGRLADAFGPTYRPVSGKVRANADAIPPWFTELATATSISANLYSSTDADVAEQFHALTGSSGGAVLLGPPLGGG